MSTVVADPAPGKGIVLYDGDCPFCRRSVAILKRLDWLGRLHFQSARDVDHLPPSHVSLDSKRLLDEMHVLTPDRRHAYAGYSAFRWIAWRLPLAVPAAPLLYVPGVPWVGNRIYLWVAKNRMNLVPCTDGACPVHLKRS
jgi:predicted DCC family thiol-disulfide oxidoreductase YuxK